jgi:hypothetical protein
MKMLKKYFMMAMVFSIVGGCAASTDSSGFSHTVYVNVPGSIGYKYSLFHKVDVGVELWEDIRIAYTDSSLAFDQDNSFSVFVGYPIQIQHLFIIPRVFVSSGTIEKNIGIALPIFYEVWRNDHCHVRPGISFIAANLRNTSIKTDASVEFGFGF